MCHAIPAEIVALLPDDMARVNLGGVVKEVSLGLIEEAVVGDYVLIHVGFALSKIDRDEAQRTLEMFSELADAMGETR